jgi:hypothetical protein
LERARYGACAGLDHLITDAFPAGGLIPGAGHNTIGRSAYAGARALPGHGLHRYVFQLFALDRGLSFTKPPRLRGLLRAMRGSVIARARLDAFFERKSAKPK